MKTGTNPTAEKSVSRLTIEEHANGGFTVSTDGRNCGERSEIVASYSNAFDLIEGLEVMVGAIEPDAPINTTLGQAIKDLCQSPKT